MIATRPVVTATALPSALCPEASFGGQVHGMQKFQDVETVFLSEQIWHIQAAKCIALGMAPKEVAEICEKCVGSIYAAMRAPHFQARVVKYMEEAGTNMAEMFQNDSLAARATLIEINNDPKVSPAVRVSAAKEILDRGYGKAVTYIESKTQTITADPILREEELKREIKLLRSSQDLIQDLSDDRDTITLS